MFEKNKIKVSSLIITMVLILLSVDASAHHHMVKRIKAAYIYNFAKLVEWPEASFESAESPILLGILGDDPFKPVLMKIDNKIAKGRPIIIKNYKNTAEIGKCHILYVAESEKYKLGRVLKKIKNRPCLTISNIKGFAKRGGMINFTLLNNRVRFKINLQIVRNSGLKVSSRLLKLATIVGEKSIKEGK